MIGVVLGAYTRRTLTLLGLGFRVRVRVRVRLRVRVMVRVRVRALTCRLGQVWQCMAGA